MKHYRSLFFYRAFGLSIAAQFEVAGIPVGGAGEDVIVRLEKIESAVFETELNDAKIVERDGSTVWVTPQATCYAWDGFGRALVRDGKEIVIEPADEISPSEFSPFITGALFGHLLHQRQLTVLHGSSVLSNAGASLFLGDKGAGKSTLAASMANSGFVLLTDDLVPITLEEGRIKTHSGFARSKLWPDSIESLGLDPNAFPKIMSFIEKRGLPHKNNIDKKVSVDSVYVIGVSDRQSIRRLSRSDAFFELNRNLYLIHYLEPTNATARDFKCCEQIANTVPVYLLERPHDFGQISKVSEMVAEHITRG